MKRQLSFVAIVAAVIGASFFQAASADTPNPLTCEGYAENRVFMESQSWVEPQTGAVDHPGTGEQGHIHVSTCFPLYQVVTSPTLSLDIRLQLHNVPGEVGTLNVELYQMGGPTGGTMRVTVPSGGDCAVADCDRWFHVDFPLSESTESGWVEFEMYPQIHSVDANGVRTGLKWYNLTRWFFDLQNGAPPRDDPLTPSMIYIGGDTWFSGPGTNYSVARIAPSSFPWDFETGEMIPVSGTWTPSVLFKHAGRVLIDPVLHADPPNFGWEVYNNPTFGGNQFVNLSIDTTQLTNGPHRMLLISCNPNANGGSGITNCGVLVVSFVVDNFIPADVTLEPGQTYIVDCPTTLSGTIGANRAELACSES